MTRLMKSDQVKKIVTNNGKPTFSATYCYERWQSRTSTVAMARSEEKNNISPESIDSPSASEKPMKTGMLMNRT
ncbi:Hypothetical predicted protein, partial [Olea europaea subsp. europaea]